MLQKLKSQNLLLRKFLNTMIEIKQKVNEIEQEYLHLLEQIYEQKESLSLLAILDAIRLFWFKNRNAVFIFFEALKEKEVFIYTGATYLDVTNKEYFGFIACGKIHVMDDQLYKYADTVLLKDDFPSRNKILNQVFITIKDNISVLKDLNDYIFLLPVRLFYEKVDFYKLAENVFLNFFDNKFKTPHDYFLNCKTITDISKSFREDLKNRILLYDSDDIRMTFEQRMNNIPKDLYGFSDISHTFLLNLMGYIIQALEIVEVIHDFNMIPIIRNDATLSYFYLIEASTSTDDNYLNKSILANSIYRYFRKNLKSIKELSINEVSKKYSDTNIFYEIHKKLELEKKSIDDIDFATRMKIIEEVVSEKNKTESFYD